MNPISIESIISTKNTLEKELFEEYMKFNEIELKEHEINTLEELKRIVPSITNYSFYFGYKIPQLAKEFDTLIFNENKVMNIELKSQKDIKAIKQQLLRNFFYLQYLNFKMELITFDASEGKFYKLNFQTNELDLISAEDFHLLLQDFQSNPLIDLDSLFSPSKFLLSPFNDVNGFFENKYLLTLHQEEIVKKIKKECDNDEANISAITGKPGTGKTLLVYHIGKLLSENKKVLIIHCGNLNDGHHIINKKVYEKKLYFEVCPAKNIGKTLNLSKYDVIIVDESQRIYQSQLDIVINNGRQNHIPILFSFDPRQTLSKRENTSEAVNVINSHIQKKENTYKLTEKIRSNKEIASFIKELFDLRKKNPNVQYKNIKIEYFNKPKELQTYLNQQYMNGWTCLEYTKSSYNSCGYDSYQNGNNNANSHAVIGQEFEKVAVVIDSSFYYNESQLESNGNTGGTGYSQAQMFYQNITRVRSELKLIILNNQEVFKKVIGILYDYR